MAEPVPIIGATGALGFGLAVRWGRAGVPVATRMLGVWQASLLADLDHDLDEHVLVCGNDRDDKDRVIALMARIEGLRGVDAGRLELARISINARHTTHAGIKITGL